MNYHKVDFVGSFGFLSQLTKSDKPEIVFAGKSNVGKSSLINKIFNQKSLARVSGVPGKTTTINFFTSSCLHFADLPGYGYAKVSKKEKDRWSKLIEGYFNSERDIQLVFSLLDMRHPPTKNDIVMIDFLIDSGIPFVIILTKSDKLTNNQKTQRLEQLQTEVPCADQVTMIPFSAKTGEGIPEIKAIIDDIEEEALEEIRMHEDAVQAQIDAEEFAQQEIEENSSEEDI